MKKHLSKWIALVLAIALLLSVNSAMAESGKKTLTIGDSVTFATLEPFQSTSITGVAYNCLYENLASKAATGEVIGCIAKSWEKTGDLTYNVELYDYVYDSAGNHITAKDVEYCYTKMLGVAYALYYASCVATGEYTVDLTLKDDTMGGIENSLMTVPIVSQAEYEKSSDFMASNPVSTSHYIVSDYTSGSSISFIKNENYWQKDESLIAPVSRANYDEVKFISILEASQMKIALETGVVDAIENMSSTQVTEFLDGGAKADKFQTVDISSGSGMTVLINLFLSGVESSAFHDDVNLRKAVAYAIDRNGVAMGATNGLGRACTVFGSDYSGDAPDYYEAEGGWLPYNPTLAKEYLAQSNYVPGTKLRLLAEVNTSRAAQVIETYLNAIGISVDISTPDSAVYHANYNDPNTYDFAICLSGFDYNSTYWYKQYRDVGRGYSRHGWVDPELHAAVANINTVQGHTQENINKVGKMFDERVYGIPLYNQYLYYTTNRALQYTDFNWTVTGYLALWACTTK